MPLQHTTSTATVPGQGGGFGSNATANVVVVTRDDTANYTWEDYIDYVSGLVSGQTAITGVTGVKSTNATRADNAALANWIEWEVTYNQATNDTIIFPNFPLVDNTNKRNYDVHILTPNNGRLFIHWDGADTVNNATYTAGTELLDVGLLEAGVPVNLMNFFYWELPSQVAILPTEQGRNNAVVNGVAVDSYRGFTAAQRATAGTGDDARGQRLRLAYAAFHGAGAANTDQVNIREGCLNVFYRDTGGVRDADTVARTNAVGEWFFGYAGTKSGTSGLRFHNLGPYRSISHSFNGNLSLTGAVHQGTNATIEARPTLTLAASPNVVDDVSGGDVYRWPDLSLVDLSRLTNITFYPFPNNQARNNQLIDRANYPTVTTFWWNNGAANNPDNAMFRNPIQPLTFVDSPTLNRNNNRWTSQTVNPTAINPDGTPKTELAMIRFRSGTALQAATTGTNYDGRVVNLFNHDLEYHARDFGATNTGSYDLIDSVTTPTNTVRTYTDGYDCYFLSQDTVFPMQTFSGNLREADGFVAGTGINTGVNKAGFPGFVAANIPTSGFTLPDTFNSLSITGTLNMQQVGDLIVSRPHQLAVDAAAGTVTNAQLATRAAALIGGGAGTTNRNMDLVEAVGSNVVIRGFDVSGAGTLNVGNGFTGVQLVESDWTFTGTTNLTSIDAGRVTLAGTFQAPVTISASNNITGVRAGGATILPSGSSITSALGISITSGETYNWDGVDLSALNWNVFANPPAVTTFEGLPSERQPQTGTRPSNIVIAAAPFNFTFASGNLAGRFAVRNVTKDVNIQAPTTVTAGTPVSVTVANSDIARIETGDVTHIYYKPTNTLTTGYNTSVRVYTVPTISADTTVEAVTSQIADVLYPTDPSTGNLITYEGASADTTANGTGITVTLTNAILSGDNLTGAKTEALLLAETDDPEYFSQMVINERTTDYIRPGVQSTRVEDVRFASSSGTQQQSLQAVGGDFTRADLTTYTGVPSVTIVPNPAGISIDDSRTACALAIRDANLATAGLVGGLY